MTGNVCGDIYNAAAPVRMPTTRLCCQPAGSVAAVESQQMETALIRCAHGATTTPAAIAEGVVSRCTSRESVGPGTRVLTQSSGQVMGPRCGRAQIASGDLHGRLPSFLLDIRADPGVEA